MTSKLAVYNKTLVLLVERPLLQLSEPREAKRVLDSQWDEAVAYCLAQGLWRFAKRAVAIDASSTVTPAFGLLNAFTIPDDWVRTVTTSANPTLDMPAMEAREESGYWYANCDPLYASYVSADPLYGLDLGKWPANFTDYVAIRLANQSFGGIPSKDAELADRLERKEKIAKRNAKGSDAMNDPPGQAPVSQLVRSRLGGIGYNRGFGGRENG